MKFLLIATCLVGLLGVSSISKGQDAAYRFAPLQADQLTAEQKKWAETITAPPRNGKYTNPPYRAYIHSPELATRLNSTLRLSALEYVTPGKIKRTCNPNYSPSMDRPIRVVRTLPSGDQSRARSCSGGGHRKRQTTRWHER